MGKESFYTGHYSGAENELSEAEKKLGALRAQIEEMQKDLRDERDGLVAFENHMAREKEANYPSGEDPETLQNTLEARKSSIEKLEDELADLKTEESDYMQGLKLGQEADSLNLKALEDMDTDGRLPN